MKTNIVTNLLGRKCHYDRLFCEDWKRTEEESEIVAVMFVPDEEDSEQPKVWVTVKNTDGNLVVVNSTDVYVVDYSDVQINSNIDTTIESTNLLADEVETELYSLTNTYTNDYGVTIVDFDEVTEHISKNFIRKV